MPEGRGWCSTNGVGGGSLSDGRRGAMEEEERWKGWWKAETDGCKEWRRQNAETTKGTQRKEPVSFLLPLSKTSLHRKISDG